MSWRLSLIFENVVAVALVFVLLCVVLCCCCVVVV